MNHDPVSERVGVSEGVTNARADGGRPGVGPPTRTLTLTRSLTIPQ
jgi:hypothetical protein